jgi:hypothetical protein
LGQRKCVTDERGLRGRQAIQQAKRECDHEREKQWKTEGAFHAEKLPNRPGNWNLLFAPFQKACCPKKDDTVNPRRPLFQNSLSN